MSRLGILGATALSLTLAAASPALAQHMRGGGAGVRAGGMAAGAHVGAPSMGGGTAFRGAQASVGSQNFAGRGNAQFAQGNAQFSQGAARGGRGFDRGDHGGRFWRGAGFVAGVAGGGAARDTRAQ